MKREWLLLCGVAAGPFYLALGIGQALLREGFDFAKHPLSVLANGPWGWIQTLNFVVTGTMVIAAAVGVARVPGLKVRGMIGCLAFYGAAMLVASVFPADPVDGFPTGTPKGPPTSITTTGLVHFISGALGFISLTIGCFLAAGSMWRQSERQLAGISLAGGLTTVFGFFGGFVLPIGIAGIWIGVVAGWIWLSVVSLLLRHRIV